MLKSAYPISPNYKQIDSYILNMSYVLGKGSYGSIILGYDIPHKIFLAIKIISLDNIADQKSLDYLKSEIVNMQMANHKNIVRLYDVRRSKSNIYLIMEYCEDGNLEKYLYDRGGRLSEKESIRILRKIVSGYKCLHGLNIVHRDLKLANILTDKGEIKIADLGYSKLVENFKKDFLVSRVGTMLYMSPQILEATHYTNKTDVWSLGIMFYQMLFGRNPWNLNADKNPNIVMNFLKVIREKGLEFPKDIKASAKSKNLLQEMLMYDEEDRLSWEEIFQEEFLKEEEEDQFKNIEEYFVKNRTIDSIYECERFMKENIIKKIPLLQPLNIQNNKSIESSMIDKRELAEIFQRKRQEDDEREIGKKIYKLLLQKRNLSSLLINILIESYEKFQIPELFILLKREISRIYQSISLRIKSPWKKISNEEKTIFYKDKKRIFSKDLLKKKHSCVRKW